MIWDQRVYAVWRFSKRGWEPYGFRTNETEARKLVFTTIGDFGNRYVYRSEDGFQLIVAVKSEQDDDEYPWSTAERYEIRRYYFTSEDDATEKRGVFYTHIIIDELGEVHSCEEYRLMTGAIILLDDKPRSE